MSSGRTASFIASPNAAGKSVIASSGGVEVAVEEDVSVSTISEERREAGCVPVLEEALPLEVAEKLFYMVFGVMFRGIFLDNGATRYKMISKALEGLTIESASDLQRILKIKEYTSQLSVFLELMEPVPVFQSCMGAMLFLISALLSRGLDLIQADRDDPTLPLVTAPFGHASQEIVNLLLCGQAAPNVFDGRMDIGGGMFLNGIPDKAKIVPQFLQRGPKLETPQWPIWVVGSDSHYTVLFSPNISVQDENEYEERKSKIRQAFNTQDQSGGGGFMSVEGLHQVLRETNINFPPEKLNNLCSTGFIVWSEFLQCLLDLDKDLGGLKDSSGMMGWKRFDVYHFNGIAKSVSSGNQKPRLCNLRVSIPPKWSPEDFMATSGPSDEPGGRGEGKGEVSQPEPPQYAPLVDYIRTRWPRAVCNWVGNPPNIV
ncbi:hypothetical protein QJS10_CPA08g01330 [Acorus calamus]|uniref:ubiquitinyl hydrolase 1 n=1 Tax=Acorus calamus TaxID=4465 RepID=A0AAV9ECP1_ACOCL|nr:hypothetical protein QJS10_CPA08g01330 [Acorus calamus]